MTAVAGGRRPPVVVVTGGGGGIGAAIADELGRRGCFVVTMDPLVTLDGAEQLPAPEETTAGRIVAAGGSARASSVSVTDGDAVRDLFAGLVEELGGLDGVVNVAGITRPTTFASGTEEDWLAVLSVHLGGYLNVLAAALPIMAAAGRGRILGVTSGSGWRPADTGAYGCAKRAVASLTWQLGRVAPPGVAVNAISPIAVTRMVTAALGRSAAAGGAAGGGSGSSTGGLSLGSMPEPEHLGPFGAHLVADDLAWCNGRVLFAGGAEVAVIDEPRLLEVVRTGDVTSLPALLDAVTGALVAAESKQASGGGSNPRFGPVFEAAPEGFAAAGSPGTCAIVSDRREVAAAVAAALGARGVASIVVDPGAGVDFEACASALAAAAEGGPLDAVVVATAGATGAAAGDGAWGQVLAEHGGIVDGIRADACWARAASDHAAGGDRPMRLVVLTEATSAGGRSRAQAAAQHSRAALRATGDRLAALTVSLEGADAGTAGEVAAHLVCSPEAAGLSGAELVAGEGWVGLRSHPRPGGSVAFGGPGVPDWLDGALAAMVGSRE